MKTTTLILILFLTALASWAQPTPSQRRLPQRVNLATNAPAAPAMPPVPGTPPATAPDAPAAPSAAPAAAPAVSAAPAAPAAPKPPEEMIPAGNINFQGVDVSQVLDVYAQLVGRTMLRAGLPSAQIILRTETPLTKTEAIQALQAVLALNGIALVNVGDKFVKVLPIEQANSAGAKIDHGDASQLPEMGSYVTHIVQLKYIKPSVMMPLILPFAKLANAIFPIDDNGILVLRDNAENVKRMLEMIDQIDVSVPTEYVSEVIPIKYAMAEDIASALNSLGGSGGSTVSFGGSGAASSGGGTSRPGGTGTGNTLQSGANSQANQPRALGSQATPGGTPTGGTTFQQRLQSIIQRASTGGQQDQIQVFGQAKIIADQRSNSLLVFATQADMEKIKAVVAKLDVLLSQVLIESVIMDVGLTHSWNLGISAAQNPKIFSPSQQIAGGGGMNNGQTFANFLNGGLNGGLVNSNSSSSSSIFGNSLPGGLSYFGNIGPNWDVALQAAAADSTTSVIQRPRIQTSQAKAASFFVGQTVPYVTGSTYGSAYGNSSSYSQLSVGVELDVTPFINPDGLVVMDINQEIDDLNGYTTIENVGNVPNTTKRTLSSEIAVRDRDTIILGGFVRSDKSKSKSGVPLLMDIPILGNLFTSRSDSKDRSETIVMIRPTVLKTPEIAAAQAVKEERRLPGISAAAAEDAESERKQVEAERRAELRRVKAQGHIDDRFNPVLPNAPVDTNHVSSPNP
ncbi:MAG: secretin N-terminal domain-containing protein [Verrucomicrobiota bacterium]|jgi:general secretion pathway protein D